MSRALRSGAPRMLGKHDGAAGRIYQAHYRALEEQHGPFTSPLMRAYAGAAAAWWSQFQMATRDVKRAEDKRARGKGRRPAAADVVREKKRQGLAWGSYEQAAARLELLAKAQRPRSFAEAARAAGGR